MKGKLILSRYEIQRQLGEGGMAKVYLARQIDLQRHVVVKIMHDHLAANPKFRERFQQEMLLMARFQHPYAVPLHDASLCDPVGPCLIMEYVKGITLETLLGNNRRLSTIRVGRLVQQLCEVLQSAHGQGFIHRDLKPANVMVVDADSAYEKIKVMDFGLAKLIGSKSLKRPVSSSGEFAIGTPAYMSPEQVNGGETDNRSDLYSLGIIMYEMLTGRLPFDGLSTMDTLLAHTTEPPPGMTSPEVWVPPSIEAVVLKCLAKKPADRPASARDLALMYEQALLAEEAAVHQAGDTNHEGNTTNDRPVALASDPTTVVFQLQAWMPEKVAATKLEGFIHDVGGKLVENAAGCIKVHLGGKGSTYKVPRSRLSWFGLDSGHSIELELQMEYGRNGNPSHLSMNVVFRFLGRTLVNNWRGVCNQIFCDLRAYLLGNAGTLREMSTV
jgi:serine/threonine-protein kinase